MAVNLKPTEEMAAEATRGLEWRREYNRGGTEVGVARARDISNRTNLSPETIGRMVSYFARHEVDKEAEGFRPGEDGYPSAGRIAWALWGGDAGQAWAKSKQKELEENNMNEIESKSAKVIPCNNEGRHANMKDFKEIRVTGSTLEVRMSVQADVESRTIRGYAAKFGTVSEPLMSRDAKYKFRETIAVGAFDEANMEDVRALFNHDNNIVLARSRNGAGTLMLGIDEIGLWYEFEAPNTTHGNDLLESVKRGDIDQSSFAFSLDEDGAEWMESGDYEEDSDVVYMRTIKKIKRIYDVSPVTEPAYSDTSVAVRSLETFCESTKPDAQNNSLSHWQRRLGLLENC